MRENTRSEFVPRMHERKKREKKNFEEEKTAITHPELSWIPVRVMQFINVGIAATYATYMI